MGFFSKDTLSAFQRKSSKPRLRPITRIYNSDVGSTSYGVGSSLSASPEFKPFPVEQKFMGFTSSPLTPVVTSPQLPADLCSENIPILHLEEIPQLEVKSYSSNNFLYSNEMVRIYVESLEGGASESVAIHERLAEKEFLWLNTEEAKKHERAGPDGEREFYFPASLVSVDEMKNIVYWIYKDGLLQDYYLESYEKMVSFYNRASHLQLDKLVKDMMTNIIEYFEGRPVVLDAVFGSINVLSENIDHPIFRALLKILVKQLPFELLKAQKQRWPPAVWYELAMAMIEEKNAAAPVVNGNAGGDGVDDGETFVGDQLDRRRTTYDDLLLFRAHLDNTQALFEKYVARAPR